MSATWDQDSLRSGGQAWQHRHHREVLPNAEERVHSARPGSVPAWSGVPRACALHALVQRSSAPWPTRRSDAGRGLRRARSCLRTAAAGTAATLASSIEVRITSGSGRCDWKPSRAAATRGDVRRWATTFARRLTPTRRLAIHSCPSPTEQPRHPCAWNCIVFLCHEFHCPAPP